VFDGYGRATCDAGSSSLGPLFCDCAPSANGTFNLGSSCWWRNDPTGGEAVKEPTCDFGGGRLGASLTDPDGTVLGHTGAGARTALIEPFSTGATPSIGSLTTTGQGGINRRAGFPFGSPLGLLVKLRFVGGCRESAYFGLARAEGVLDQRLPTFRRGAR